MPFQSQAQAGWAFATGQPFARRWARQTGPYKRLPYKKGKRKKEYTLDQLEMWCNSPCYDPRIAAAIAAGIPELPRLKGEQIAPGITRIRGNLCNVHGKYGPCDKALSGGKGKKPKGGKGRKPAKAKLTPEQRAQQREQEQAANRAKTLGSLNIAPDGQAALEALRSGQQPDPAAVAAAGLEGAGLVERAEDGTMRMSASGRALMAAAGAGDIGRAGDVISASRDRAAARTARQQAAADRKLAAATRAAEAAARRAELDKQRQERASGGGGGGSGGSVGRSVGGSTEAAERARIRFEQAQQDRQERLDRIARHEAEREARRREAAVPKARTNVVGAGTNRRAKAADYPDQSQYAGYTMEDWSDDPPQPTTTRDITADRARLAKHFTSEQIALLERLGLVAPEKRAKAAAEPGDYLVVEDREKPSTWHLQVKRGGTPDHGLMGAAWAALHGGYRGNTYQGPQKAEALARLKKLYEAERMPVPTEKAFRVFKDARGAWRWVAQSSTAYRDRDKEIVSTKALADDCARADASGQYGPLRWWHVPGVDLGQCDFNMMIGPVLIESGTFYSEQIAQKVARAAPDLELSLGFFHPASEPDAEGVFHHIRRFERSLTPRGKASNLFTNFQVKESKPMDDIKKAALKAIGFSDSDIADIEARAVSTQKSADDQGIAFKAEEPAPEPAPIPEVVFNGQTYVLKAAPPPPAPEGSPAEEGAESPEMESGEMEMGDDAEGEGGLTLSPEDLTAIGQAVGAALTQALGPLVGALDMTNKMGAHMEELKSMMAGYGGAQAKKDAESAALREQVAAQAKVLAEFTGDAPAVGYRPSAAADNIVTEAGLLGTIVEAKKDASGGDLGPFADIIKGLGLLPGQR